VVSMSMARFFDYSRSLLEYFQEVDRRFDRSGPVELSPANISPYQLDDTEIKVVLWDVYGTICGVGLGDLEKSLEYEDRLQLAAKETVAEFSLEGTFNELYPDQPPEEALVDLYMELIAESHQKSQAMGVQYPEVVIENIWEQILTECRQGQNARPIADAKEASLYTAYRWAYFFDGALQRTYLYSTAAKCLQRLARKPIAQGIISNAQFYTPLHLRRLLRRDLKQDDLELDEFFHEQLVFFSYELGFSKPNPAIFEQAIEAAAGLGINPQQILYVGNDMLNDIYAAGQFGMQTALFVGDGSQVCLRQDEPCCRNLRPNAIVTQIEQIADMLT
jgi:putative hydrolase of the HAD superfamily